MYRMVRTALWVMFAFVAGIFYERAHQQSLCAASGGEWLRAGLCGAVQ